MRQGGKSSVPSRKAIENFAIDLFTEE